MPAADASEGQDPAADRSPEAFERGLAALRRRERGSAELAEWLAARGYEHADVNTAIGRLTEVGELDDRRFATRFAEDKRDLRGWGPERIGEALAGRGIPRELIDLALGEDGHADQLARAAGLLERRAKPVATDGERGRALAYLTRRGYDYDLAYEAVRLHGREAA